MCTDEKIEFSGGFWCGQNIFSNTKNKKNSNKEVEKLQKLNEVQNKAKQKKTKGVLTPKSIECAHRKYEKVNILYTKNKQSCRILGYTVFGSGQGKCC